MRLIGLLELVDLVGVLFGSMGRVVPSTLAAVSPRNRGQNRWVRGDSIHHDRAARPALSTRGRWPEFGLSARVVSGPEHSRLHLREVTGETARGGASLTPKPGWTALARCKCLGRGPGWRVVRRACTLSPPNRPAWGRTRSPFRRLDSTAAQYDRRDRGTENRRRPGRKQWTPNDATAK